MMLLPWKKMLGFIAAMLIINCSSTFAASNQIITKEGHVTVEGGRIWYKIVSSEKAKRETPLVILHGGPGFPHDYLKVLENLADERPVIFYDQLGCGHSQVDKSNTALWNINRYERELETLIAHLQFKKIHLMGHSWGGALAIEYARKHPETLKSLILASPLLSAQRWTESAKTRIGELPSEVQQTIWVNEQQGTTDSKAYLNAVDMYYHHFVCRLTPWPTELTYAVEHFNPEIYKTMWGASEFSVSGNLQQYDAMSSLKRLNMPVLITTGKYDEAGPETLAFATQQLLHGELIIFENSSHVAFIEEKDAYLKAVRLFLKRI